MKLIKFTLFWSLGFIAIGLFTACEKESVQSSHLTPVALNTPLGFPTMVIPSDNQPFQERIDLGRKLYYDTLMSGRGLACASCHIQSLGFTINHSNQGMPVLPHVNMAWKNNFMWDGRKQGSLEDVMLFEVDEFFQTDLSVFNANTAYVQLFEEAFGERVITSEMMAKALAQFARTQTSYQSKYDRVQAGLESFTTEEQAGFTIFSSEAGSCTHCHTPPLFGDDHLHNTGLDSVYTDVAQRGYFNTSGDSTDLGRMRTAVLRNVELRSRFMHDGRYGTLREAVEHYNSGVLVSPSLDPVMIKGNGSTQLNLNSNQVDQVVAFLHTLTDTVFTNSGELSKPE